MVAVAALLALVVDTPARAEHRTRPDDAQQRAANLLRVAALLVSDGHLDRAATTLAGIDPSLQGLDRARFHTLSGLLALRRGEHALAERQLLAAIQAGQSDRSAQLLLAQARLGQQDHRGALAALDRTGELGGRYPEVQLMRAQCHWRLGDRVSAWRALDEGLRRHGRHEELLRQRVLLMVDLGLFQQATAAGLRYLARHGSDAGGSVAIAEALRRGSQHRRAILILEQARLRFPRSDALLRQLARSYLDDGKPLAAAELLARAAHRSPELRVEAAELYRRAGLLQTAVYLNARAPQQPAKVRQRLGLLVELERFEEAAALTPRLSRLGLLADEEIRYALAYALFRTGRFAAAARHLRQISRPALFARAIELQKAMDACSEQPWECE